MDCRQAPVPESRCAHGPVHPPFADSMFSYGIDTRDRRPRQSKMHGQRRPDRSVTSTRSRRVRTVTPTRRYFDRDLRDIEYKFLRRWLRSVPNRNPAARILPSKEVTADPVELVRTLSGKRNTAGTNGEKTGGSWLSREHPSKCRRKRSTKWGPWGRERGRGGGVGPACIELRGPANHWTSMNVHVPDCGRYVVLGESVQ